MSVAFRRESDEEHKEPRFELPLPAGPNLVTARGLALIQAKVAELDAARAGADGDEARAMVRRELNYWTTRAATARIAPLPDGEEAAFGTRVGYRLDGVDATVDIVGHDEAEPPASVAFSAPLARALIGLAPGESAPFGEREVTVTAVAPLAA